jgi:hypothetical protein
MSVHVSAQPFAPAAPTSQSLANLATPRAAPSVAVDSYTYRLSRSPRPRQPANPSQISQLPEPPRASPSIRTRIGRRVYREPVHAGFEAICRWRNGRQSFRCRCVCVVVARGHEGPSAARGLRRPPILCANRAVASARTELSRAPEPSCRERPNRTVASARTAPSRAPEPRCCERRELAYLPDFSRRVGVQRRRDFGRKIAPVSA